MIKLMIPIQCGTDVGMFSSVNMVKHDDVKAWKKAHLFSIGGLPFLVFFVSFI